MIYVVCNPVDDASHFGAGAVAFVYWVSFGLLASYVVPNFLLLVTSNDNTLPQVTPGAKAPHGALSVSTEGVLTAAISVVVPSVALALYGRKII